MKRIISFFFFALSLSTLHTQEISCKVVRTAPYFVSAGLKDNIFVGNLNPGEIITVINVGGYVFIDLGQKEFNIWFIKDGNKFSTHAKNLVLMDTENLFGHDVITNDATFLGYDDYPIFAEMWVPVHYSDVLASKNRESLPKYEPYLINYDKNAGYAEHYSSAEWYDIMYGGIDEEGMVSFFSSIIYTSGGVNNFLVKNIAIRDYGYEVLCYGPENVRAEYDPYFNWSLCNNELITLFLYIDNEYIDIYVNEYNSAHKFGTVIRVQEEFIRQYQRLIKTNTCDLTNVIWPRRADKQIETGKTYRTAEVLRLRTSEDKNSELIMEMPGNTVVHVVETGAKDSIDGITANWVKVRLDNGAEGWCFGGYLLADVVSVNASKDSDLPEGNAAQEAVVTESPPQTAFPFMLLIAIAGGVVMLAVIVVVLIRRKR
jgi:hypothetical protein